jgi:Na+/glutamate symporter
MLAVASAYSGLLDLCPYFLLPLFYYCLVVVVVGGVTCDHLEYGTVHAVKYNDA